MYKLGNNIRNKQKKVIILNNKSNILLIPSLPEIKNKSPLPIVARVNEPKLKIKINILDSVVSKEILLIIKEIEKYINSENIPKSVENILKKVLLLLKDPIKIKNYDLDNIENAHALEFKLSIITWNIINEIVNKELVLQNIKELITNLEKIKLENNNNNNYINIIITESINAIMNINQNDPYILYDC